MRVTNSLCTRVAIVVQLPDKAHLVVAQGSPMENNWYDLSGILEGTINGKSEIRLIIYTTQQQMLTAQSWNVSMF